MIRGTSRGTKRFLKNTAMLYILRFSTYLFSFITVPYQTRVLGPVNFAKIGVAGALMVYFYLVIDFGFLLSGTEKVANHASDREEVSAIYTEITLAKLLLSLLSAVMLMAFLAFVPGYRKDVLFYFLFLIFTALDTMLPDFVYRGLEDMTPITLRSVTVRALFTVLVFVFVRKPGDYILIPLIQCAGSLIAFLWAAIDLKKRHGIRFVRVTKQGVIGEFSLSKGFFLSRIASTIYSSFNTLFLNQLPQGKTAVADYTLSYKLLSMGQSALSPISDSLYIYMLQHKDFRMIKKILLTFMPIITAFCVGVMIFAEPFCAILFGAEYRSAGAILRAMMPSAILTLPDYLFGFPSLSPLGKAKHANISIYISCSVHVINLVVFSALGMLNAVTLAALSSFAIFVEFCYRFGVVWTTLRGRREGGANA